VNAFYVVNSVHDITYIYGFNEQAFNFQRDNKGKGGRDSDPVKISVQSDSGSNNAAFNVGFY
jgi:extracellular elastinolytic metalloproteinase